MQISGKKLLFVEDDKELTLRLSEHFSEENIAVFVSNLDDAKKYLRFIQFDAVVLDLLLGETNGLKLFSATADLPPVVIYSSLGSDFDIINALSQGAVDYVVKPCSMRLLEAKLKLRLRPSREGILSSGGLKLNPVNKMAKYYEQTIPLTASEFNILYFLMKKNDRFFTSDQLYEKVWNLQSLNTATVRKHISSLRHKLTQACNGTDFIRNEFAKGYAFCGDVSAE